MTHEELLERIAEIAVEREESVEALVLEPRHFFDAFIVGIAERGHDLFVLYDKEAMTEAMVATAREEEDDGEEHDFEDEIAEHYDFNMNQAGEGKPAFVIMRSG